MPKKSGPLVFLLLCLFASLQLAAQQSGNFKKEIYISKGDSLPYRILYPANYDKKKHYPIVLFLHGAGERGTDNEIQLAILPAALRDSAGRRKYPCFIVAPQCPKNDVWVNFPHFPEILKATDTPTTSMRLAMELVTNLQRDLPLDRHRVYLTGYSMGGEGSFDLLTRRPDWFAAVVPVCSVSDTSKALSIAKIPIWAFHGDQDDINDVKYTRMMISAIKSHGGKPLYTEYPGVKHNSWVQAYKEPALYDWLFSQKRP